MCGWGTRLGVEEVHGIDSGGGGGGGTGGPLSIPPHSPSFWGRITPSKWLDPPIFVLAIDLPVRYRCEDS